MVKCETCEQEMLESDTCKTKIITINGVVFERNSTYFDVNERCHDCYIVNEKGNYHHFGCDMEKCPKCKGQLISCGCGKKTIGKEVFQ